MNNKIYDVAIVGGGHNGLTTACYLAKAGLKVIVVEKHDYVGGAAISRELYPGWTYTNCSYVCSLLRPEIFRDLELAKYRRNLVLKNLYDNKYIDSDLYKKLEKEKINLNKSKKVYLEDAQYYICLLYTSPSPRDQRGSRMPSSA